MNDLTTISNGNTIDGRITSQGNDRAYECHGITGIDAVGIRSIKTKPAWHGLGIECGGFESAAEAMSVIAPWDVDLTDGVTGVGELDDGRGVRLVSDNRIVYRKDNGALLGTVGAGYSVMQNSEGASIIDSLRDTETVFSLETIGTYGGGKIVWCLLSAKSLAAEIVGGDTVLPYIHVRWGHDGTASFSARGTSIRVVCRNTDMMSASRRAIFRISHTASMSDRLAALRQLDASVVADWTKSVEAYRSMAQTSVSRERVQELWTGVYERMISRGPVNPNPTTEAGQKALERFERAMVKTEEIFEQERANVGGNLWAAFNAITGYAQHARNRLPGKADARANDSLNGSGARITAAAKEMALAMI